MKLITTGSAVAALFFCIAQPESVPAQPTSASQFQSSGLQASMGNVVARGRFVTVQLALKNTTNRRLYLLATGSQNASLSSGDILDLQEMVGVSYCFATNGDDANLEGCMNPGHSEDPSHYTVLEPNSTIAISFRYRLPSYSQPAVPGDTISFALKGLMRVGGSDPGEAGTERPTEPRTFSIGFPLIRIP
jgi:hypothetical protein